MSEQEGVQQYVECVVDLDQVADLTMQGWEVVERVEFDEPINFIDQALNPTQNQYPATIEVRRCALGKKVAFRVRKSGSEVLAQSAARIVQLTNELAQANTVAKQAAAELEAEKLNRRRDVAMLDDQRRATERVRGDLQTSTQLRQKLEADLGKIREHIGRKAFEEILPPAPVEAKKSDVT